jgi:hypothetical protein
MPVEIIFPTPESTIVDTGTVFAVILTDASVVAMTVSCSRADAPGEVTVGRFIETMLFDDGVYQWTFLVDLPEYRTSGEFTLAVVSTDQRQAQRTVNGGFRVGYPGGGSGGSRQGKQSRQSQECQQSQEGQESAEAFAVAAAAAITRITSPAVPGNISTSYYVTTGTYAAPLETGAGVAAGSIPFCMAGYPCLWNELNVVVARSSLVAVNGYWSVTYRNVPAGHPYTERVQDKAVPPGGQTLGPLTT